ncbi:CynX/NimT family MFS transporter [Hydrogenophaga sp. T2]|uniref:MFS transporter n=1 Tax=Hydrogenophaga sp. T2 TaxID=3132823 RepID=UPI003CE9912F
MSVPKAIAPASQWPAILLLVGAGLVSAVQLAKVPAAMQAIQAALGMPLERAAWLLSAFGVVGALFGTAIGTATDRLGARRTLVAGLALQGAASAAGALVQGAPLLIASRLVEGVGFLAVIVAAPALIARVVPASRAAGPMAAWSSFMPAGMALVLLASPWLLIAGWRALWWVSSALALAYAALAAWCAPRDASQRPPARDRALPLHRTLLARGPLALMLLFMLYAGSWFALFGLLPVVLEGGLAATPAQANMLTALAIASGGIGNLAGGALLARGMRPATLVAGTLGVCALLALAVATESLGAWTRYWLVVAFATVAGCVPPALFAEASVQAPHESTLGLTIGMMMQGNNLGLVAGPAAGAALTVMGGWPALAAGVAALAGAGIVGAVWLLPKPVAAMQTRRLAEATSPPAEARPTASSRTEPLATGADSVGPGHRQRST